MENKTWAQKWCTAIRIFSKVVLSRIFGLLKRGRKVIQRCFQCNSSHRLMWRIFQIHNWSWPSLCLEDRKGNRRCYVDLFKHIYLLYAWMVWCGLENIGIRPGFHEEISLLWRLTFRDFYTTYINYILLQLFKTYNSFIHMNLAKVRPERWIWQEEVGRVHTVMFLSNQIK